MLQHKRFVGPRAATTKFLIVMVCAILAAFTLTSCQQEKSSNRRYPDRDTTTGVELFQWTWPAIAAECPTLAKLGYSLVQTSPPQESIVGDSPEAAYQPVSYKLESSLGTRAEFAAMVSACQTVGVVVRVDVVLNNMAGVESGVGTGGTKFTKYDYPGLYSPDDFHHCGTPGDEILDQNNRAQVQNCEVQNRADLDTSKPTVQQAIADYLSDLHKLNVSQVRIVDAENIPSFDMAAIRERLPTTIGVIYGGRGASVTPVYNENGTTEDYRIQRTLRNIFGEGALQEVRSEVFDMPDYTSRRVSLVDNHRIERDADWSIADPRAYLWAEIFLMGLDAGQPVIYSGYRFTRADAGPPRLKKQPTRVQAAVCEPATEPWTCHHRNPAIAGMLAFRSAAQGAEPFRMLEGDLVGIKRAGKEKGRGLVAINTGDQAAQVPWDTQLARGAYCNLLVPDCAETIEVDDQAMITTPLAPGQAIAITAYQPAPPSS